MTVSRAGMTILCAALLGGCATSGPGVPSLAAEASAACAPLPGAAEARLDLVREVLAQGRPRAGLAHLDGLSPALQAAPQARYLRAEVLRRVGGDDAAAALYRRLLGGCLAGAGHHGLGRLAAAAGDLDTAVDELQRARALLPTDARVRNDLGYALLLSGRREDARHELRTAMELDDGDRRASMNLLLLLVQEGREREVRALAERLELSPGRLQQLRERARALAG